MQNHHEGISEILTTLTLIIGLPSTYLDLESQKFWYSDPASELAQRLDRIDPVHLNESSLNEFDIHITAKQNHRFGYLIFQKGTFDTHLDSSFQTAIENAVTNIILREQTLISNRQVAEQYKTALIHDLLINNIHQRGISRGACTLQINAKSQRCWALL